MTLVPNTDPMDAARPPIDQSALDMKRRRNVRGLELTPSEMAGDSFGVVAITFIGSRLDTIDVHGG